MAADTNSRGWDYAELTAIKASRAFTDPIIVHERTKGFALDEDHDVIEKIPLARLLRAQDVPIDERIEYATWPEILAWCVTAAFDQRFTNRNFRRLYQYAFRQYLDEWTGVDPDKQPDPLNEEPEFTDQEWNQIETLRFAIKKDQDKLWVENHYDDSPAGTIPKRFWLNPYEQDQEQEGMDEYTQSAASDFLDGFE